MRHFTWVFTVCQSSNLWVLVLEGLIARPRTMYGGNKARCQATLHIYHYIKFCLSGALVFVPKHKHITESSIIFLATYGETLKRTAAVFTIPNQSR